MICNMKPATNRLARRKNKKGFTLIELIVVIAILAILAAIAIPAFLGQLDNAKQKTHDANVKILKSAAAVYLAENGYPSADVVWDELSDCTNYMEDWPTNSNGWRPLRSDHFYNRRNFCDSCSWVIRIMEVV